MKVLVILLGLLPTLSVAADCSAIQNHDQRSYCVALRAHNPALCMSIQNRALRVGCRAELGDNPSDCVTIKDPDQRQLCEVRAGHSIRW